MSNKLMSNIERMFEKEKIDFELLEKNFPEVREYFTKKEQGKINHYPNGVMSVDLEGTGKVGIPSTFGYLPTGNFKFNTGLNRETMHFLAGDLLWCINNDKNLFLPDKYEELIIPPKQDLILEVKKPSAYLCDYYPIK